MKKLFLFILLFALCLACGQNAKEKRDSAILSARIALTYGKCQDAIDALEAIGRDQFSAEYLSTLSSAYACRSSFSQIVFFGTDAKKVNSANIEGSLTTFTTSTMTGTPDDDGKYADLQTAIDILLYAGNISSPSHSSRSQYFGARDLGNMSSQALYMILAQLGKFGKYYGNPDSTGLKGLGTNVNSCYFEYTDVTALATVAWLNANTSNDTCDAAATTGHPDLDIGTQTNANVVKRMCRGVVLFNNFVDVFLGTTLSVSSELAQIKDIQDDIQNYITNCHVTVNNTDLGALCNMRSQTSCESTATVQQLQIYFSAIFEPMHL